MFSYVKFSFLEQNKLKEYSKYHQFHYSQRENRINPLALKLNNEILAYSL